MPYEEIQGEVVTMSDNLEAGFSGESTDWNGADQTFVKVYWTSTGGIINSGDWADFNDNNSIIDAIKNSDLSVAEKREEINSIIYPQVTALLNSQDEDAWGTFRNHYWSCVTVG